MVLLFLVCARVSEDFVEVVPKVLDTDARLWEGKLLHPNRVGLEPQLALPGFQVLWDALVIDVVHPREPVDEDVAAAKERERTTRSRAEGDKRIGTLAFEQHFRRRVGTNYCTYSSLPRGQDFGKDYGQHFGEANTGIANHPGPSGI
jgi:hypothetical protein